MAELVSLADLRHRFPDDRFLAVDIDAERVVRCAVTETAWSIRGRSAYWSADWVTAWSYALEPDRVGVDLLQHFSWQTTAADAQSVRGITCNEAVALPSSRGIEAANDWSWFWTDGAHARCALSDAVIEVDHHDPRLMELLSHSPTASHERDGQQPDVWFGIVDQGELLSVAAVKQVADCYDIQSVVTHRQARGRGLSSEVCSHATAWALARRSVVALGMMTDNTVAERMYTRLGYICEKRWQSARFEPLSSDRASHDNDHDSNELHTHANEATCGC